MEVAPWDPADHTDLPGFAHALTRAQWMDVGISVIPVDFDILELSTKLCQLREIGARNVPDAQYFTVEMRAASHTVSRRPDFRRSAIMRVDGDR
jgi:hypothetical protein